MADFLYLNSSFAINLEHVTHVTFAKDGAEVKMVNDGIFMLNDAHALVLRDAINIIARHNMSHDLSVMIVDNAMEDFYDQKT